MSQGKSILEPQRSGEGRMAPVIARLREQTEAVTDESKGQLATQVLGLARAVRRGSDQLYDDELRRLARLGDVLADELEAAGLYLEAQGSRELLDELSQLMRRHGALFVGGAVIAGLGTLYLAPKLRQRRKRKGPYRAY